MLYSTVNKTACQDTRRRINTTQHFHARSHKHRFENSYVIFLSLKNVLWLAYSCRPSDPPGLFVPYQRQPIPFLEVGPDPSSEAATRMTFGTWELRLNLASEQGFVFSTSVAF